MNVCFNHIYIYLNLKRCFFPFYLLSNCQQVKGENIVHTISVKQCNPFTVKKSVANKACNQAIQSRTQFLNS